MKLCSTLLAKKETKIGPLGTKRGAVGRCVVKWHAKIFADWWKVLDWGNKKEADCWLFAIVRSGYRVRMVRTTSF